MWQGVHRHTPFASKPVPAPPFAWCACWKMACTLWYVTCAAQAQITAFGTGGGSTITQKVTALAVKYGDAAHLVEVCDLPHNVSQKPEVPLKLCHITIQPDVYTLSPFAHPLHGLHVRQPPLCIRPTRHLFRGIATKEDFGMLHPSLFASMQAWQAKADGHLLIVLWHVVLHIEGACAVVHHHLHHGAR